MSDKDKENVSQEPLLAMARAAARVAEKYESSHWANSSEGFFSLVDINQIKSDLSSKEVACLNLCDDKEIQGQFLRRNFLKKRLLAQCEKMSSTIDRLVGDAELGAEHTLYDWTDEAWKIKSNGWSYVLRYEYNNLTKVKNTKLPTGSGFCYVLGFFDQPNSCKIGYSTRSAAARAKEYGSEHNLELFVYDAIFSKDAAALENLVHKELSEVRVNKDRTREIFAVPPSEAVKAIKKLRGRVKNEIKTHEARELAKEEILSQVKINKLALENDKLLLKIEADFIEKIRSKKYVIKKTSKLRYKRRFKSAVLIKATIKWIVFSILIILAVFIYSIL